MKIVIDVPEEVYKRVVVSPRCTPVLDAFEDRDLFVKALQSGTPLPKGHGVLKDTDALKTAYGLEGATKYGNESKEQLENSYSTMMLYEIADMLDYAPTIIEADKEVTDGSGD